MHYSPVATNALCSVARYQTKYPVVVTVFLHYFAYQRLIRSDFDLSSVGLVAVEDEALLNQKPLIISNMGPIERAHKYVDNQTMVDSLRGYYYKKNIGLFNFISGDEIHVFIDCRKFESDFVRTLLNYPISCAFFQNDTFSLHASVVAFQGKVVMFPGSALTGKSSIAAYFVKQGGKLVTEDTAVIEVLDNRAYVRSSYPFLKLSESVNAELSFSSSRGIALQTDRNGRRGFLLNQKSFSGKLLPLDYCVFLEYGDRESVEPFKLSDATLKLVGSSLNIYPLTANKQKALFQWSANLAKCSKIFRFRRRPGIHLSRFLADFIAKDKL